MSQPMLPGRSPAKPSVAPWALAIGLGISAHVLLIAQELRAPPTPAATMGGEKDAGARKSRTARGDDAATQPGRRARDVRGLTLRNPIVGDQVVGCRDDRHCSVDRRALRAAVHGSSESVVSHLVPTAGRRGVALYGVRRGTLLHRLGFRDGDVLLRVGDFRLRSVDDLMALHDALRTRKVLSVKYRRKGVKKTKRIRISCPGIRN